ALGGNAILRKKDKPTIETQFRNTGRAMKHIAPLARRHGMVLTHGNGPQVGAVMLRSDMARKEAYELHLHNAVAQSQGEMGYMIQQCLENELRRRGIRKSVATVLTQVVVSRHDPAFMKPTKPIGPYYSHGEAMMLRRKGFAVKKDIHGGYRRVVASPKPKEIVEASSIRMLVKNNAVAIACGGGGIPAYRHGNDLKGVDAVIDKDLASSLLAQRISADAMLILTDVPKVALNYGKPGQIALRKVTASDARRYAEEGHFPAGSMGPKIEAAINFLSSGGKKVIITKPELAEKALKGIEGTTITR
ncbi:MAG: carbamate kinase, partial [Candidatus Aenigmarchaeota archaeon]|nr:carbamate kinase [Candidatus Aenigmarchaeota archaeon]